MPHWIQHRRNQNNPTFVLDGPWNPEVLLRGESIVVNVDKPEAIDYISGMASQATQIEAFIYEDFTVSLETLDINPNWRRYPVVLRIGRLGRFSNVVEKLNMMKGMNITLLFSPYSATAGRDAQIVASLGISTGIVFTEDMPLGDSIKDLIAYNFYSPMRHGSVEPFATMLTNYTGEDYVSPAMAFYDDENRFIHINEALEMASSPKNLKEGKLLGMGQEGLYNIYHSEAIQAPEWQRFFIESHPCSFCPAFRVCTGFFADRNKPEECRPVMMEILEGIEHNKKVCNNDGNNNI